MVLFFSSPRGKRFQGNRMANFVFSRVGLALIAAIVAAAAVTAVLMGRHKDTKDPRDHGGGGFREVSEQAGITWRMNFLPNEQGEKFKINLYDHGSGVAVGDYDGDGYDDIYLCNELGDNALYHNKKDGTFEEVAKKLGVALGDRICTGATWADIDNSGRQSLFVTSTGGGNVLFKNLGNGKFKDMTKEAHLTYAGHSQVAVFFDYDGDGYLDLFVGNTAEWTTKQVDPKSKVKYYPGSENGLQGIVDSPIEHNILYHNNGDGTFTNVTKQAGLEGRGWTADVAVFDYDGDGRLDLLVTNMFGMSTLYHNDGNGKFTDVTKTVLGKTSWGGMGAKAFDYNNDGLLDLYIVDMHSDMWMPVTYDRQEDQDYIDMFKRSEKTKFKYPGAEANSPLNRLFKIRKGDEVLFGNTFFKNLGNGKFDEISDQVGLETFWPWGIAVGDFDNDGFEDVFIPSGMGYPFFYWPNQLMMNNGGKNFTDRAEAEGVEPPARGKFQQETIGGHPAARSSRAAAVADFDNKGRLDIIVNNFNDRPYLFRNQFPQKNWLQLRLKGTKSNRDAVGALVHLYSGGEVMTRMVNPAGGYLAQSSKTLHFGLGDRTKVDRIEIQWPSGVRQTLEAPAINQRLDVEEPAQ
jgi:hypothetical protein